MKTTDSNLGLLNDVSLTLGAAGFVRGDLGPFHYIKFDSQGPTMEIGFNSNSAFCVNHTTGEEWWCETASLLEVYPLSYLESLNWRAA